MKKNNLIVLMLLGIASLSYAGTAKYPHEQTASNRYHNQCYNAKGKVSSCRAAKLECRKIANSKERGLCFSKVRNVKSGAYR